MWLLVRSTETFRSSNRACLLECLTLDNLLTLTHQAWSNISEPFGLNCIIIHAEREVTQRSHCFIFCISFIRLSGYAKVERSNKKTRRNTLPERKSIESWNANTFESQILCELIRKFVHVLVVLLGNRLLQGFLGFLY